MAYDHTSVEARWQRYWDEKKSFRALRRPGHPKYYVLDMFPYPSGSGLHVGHPEGYTATDIVARYKRMCGFDVLHPMGWDAFGLPAEQHAIATGTRPKDTTKKNIEVFRKQLKSLGFSYDWEREVDTTELSFVRGTQWIFLQLFKRGLAIQAEVPVNWCPALGTVLANEEVIDGLSERGSHPVVRQPLRQWQLLITRYADRLAKDLEDLDWPETREKQRQWIGRSEGAEVHFPVVGCDDKLSVFTTRPDTLFGATYMVVAPDHPLCPLLITNQQQAEAQRYIDKALKKSERERTTSKEKTGVFTGSYARNPMNGAEIPIYVGDYVLGAYGTGAIMAVPAHDERDFEFAKAQDLPIVEVVSPDGELHAEFGEAFTGEGISVRSGAFDGKKTDEMKSAVVAYLEEQGFGSKRVNYKLRDWIFSRQRYWGEPIPIYFPVTTAGDPRAGAAYEIDYQSPIAVEESELPLALPELEDFEPGDDPQGPLARAHDWRFFQRDGKWFARETNTMPQWAGSCWYYLRYLDPHNDTQLFDPQSYDEWMPVDLYVGGAEHAVLHLLYARFWHKVLYDCGVVKHAEPFQKLVHQGMILGMSYRWYASLDDQGKLLEALPGDSDEVVSSDEGGLLHAPSGRPVEARWVDPKAAGQRDGKPVHPEHGVELLPVAEKMSKARGNVINPDDVVAEVGADSLRLYEMFMGPLEQVKPWQTSGIQGCRRFLDRVEALCRRASPDARLEGETAKWLHRTIKKVGEDIEAMRFNTAISQMMSFANHLAGPKQAPPQVALEGLLLCLSPFAPHLAQELWDRWHPGSDLTSHPWPSYDEDLCVDAVVEVPVQVNGRMRGRVRLPKDASEELAREAALACDSVTKFLVQGSIRKFVYVPGRIMNLIVK